MNQGAIPGVDHTEFMIKPPPLDIPIDPNLNPRDTFLAQFEPPGANPNHAVITLALPDRKGSIILDTTRLASKKDVAPEKQLFLPKDEISMMRWLVVGLHHVLQNSRKFGLPALQDMFCTREMNVLTIKLNDKARDFRLITRAGGDAVVKFLNELYAPNSPYLWKEPPPAETSAPATPEAAPAAVEPSPAPIPSAAPVDTAPPPVPAAEPELPPAVVTLPALESGMVFLSKSGSGRRRTVEMVGDFANLYEKESDGPWTHQREFDPTEMEVLVTWLFDTGELQPERVPMSEVKAAS
jgi:hypothetical protein